MSQQQSSGLRFDIYERVHLPEDGAGMKELTSIELTPTITVDRQGEQAVLKGHLFLSGTYVSLDEARGEEQLTHRIPVEITLPLNRIQDVNDISVEIENFDVDLLSARSLNVTGVLSLNGIEMVNTGAVDWREEEEVVFTHRVEEPIETVPISAPWFSAQAAAQAAAQQHTPAFEAVPDIAEEDTRGAQAQEAEAQPPSVEAEQPARAVESPEAVEAVEAAPAAETSEPVQAELAEAEGVDQEREEAVLQDQAEAEAVVVSAAPAAEEKKEIKIAFAGKAQEEVSSSQFGGLNTLLGSSAEAPARNAEPAEPVSSPASAATAASAAAAAVAEGKREQAEEEGRDRLEWKKLFLNSASEEPQFRRVRMCIAQKEDTIETIAERYKKNARELMLYNRLNDQYLQEGQVVYIP